MAIGLFCVRILKAHDEGQADVMYVQYPSSRLVDHGTVSVTSMQLNALMALQFGRGRLGGPFLRRSVNFQLLL